MSTAIPVHPLVPSIRMNPNRPDLWTIAHAPDPQAALVTEVKPPLSEAEAHAESLRCLYCGGPDAPAPCTVACPTGIDIPGFIAAIARGQADAAGELIFRDNPLGATCARVCPTEVLCEGACVLSALGQRPVDIGRLQRFATDRAPMPAGAPPTSPGAGRVAVVGAGPAGLAAAAELGRRGYAVTVYDQRPQPGGLIDSAIAPYRRPTEALGREVERIRGRGVQFRLGQAIRGAEAWNALESAYDAVFLGVGLGPDLPVRYPGDSLAGVFRALPFIAALKAGRWPPEAAGPRVAVVGGGNTAIDVARLAVRLGARSVTVLYRRSRAEMPAYSHEVEQAEAEGVSFSWLIEPVRLIGRERVTGIEVRYMRLGEPPAGSRRRRPEPIAGSEFVIPVDTVVLALGQAPQPLERSELVRAGGRIAVDPRTGQTPLPGYFAGGDAVNGGATVVEAVREGLTAARAIDRALRGSA